MTNDNTWDGTGAAFDPLLDKPINGALAIAEELNLLGKDGLPSERKAYHVLENGYVDASKRGDTWWSTRRRLLNPNFKRIA
jgi:hypothetical protein